MRVHSRLKSATADLHVEVESTLDLDKITKSMAAYLGALGIIYLVFDRSYKELADIDFQPLKIDLGSIGRRRIGSRRICTPWLRLFRLHNR